jgi:hypothetical protein
MESGKQQAMELLPLLREVPIPDTRTAQGESAKFSLQGELAIDAMITFIFLTITWSGKYLPPGWFLPITNKQNISE